MKNDVAKMLQRARECELKAAEAYGRFAEKFFHDRDAHSFWKALSADEKEHAAFIAKMESELTDAQKSEEASPSHWYPVECLLLYLDDNPSKEINSIAEAYQCTEKIESFEVTSIVQLLAREYVPDDQRNEMLHKQLEVHYKMIENFKGPGKSALSR